MLGERLKQALKDAGVPYAKAAAEIGISEGNLYNIFKKNSFEIAYLVKAARLVGLPISYFLEEAGRPPAPSLPAALPQPAPDPASSTTSGQAPARVADPETELAQCQRANEALRRELALTNALVAAKDETIALLRGSYRPLP